jgi:hypothetical protein
VWWPLTIDGGGDGPSSSPGFGEVDCHGLLHLKCRLAMVQFNQVGFNGCLLVGELALLLRSSALGINLPSTGSHLLLLLIGLLLLRKEPDA